MRIKTFVIAVLLLTFYAMPVYAKQILLSVVTEILPIDPVSGVKSTQDVSINTVSWEASSSFTTGTTYGVPSVDDVFSVDVSIQPDSSHVFTIKGSTESGLGLGFAPAINYTVVVDFELDGSYQIYGTHDGYPAYTIKVNQNTIYSFAHKRVDLAKLTEPEEITVPTITFTN